MVTYHKVATEVEPKIQTLRKAEAELYVATKEKDAAEADLAVVQAKLDDMQVMCLLWCRALCGRGLIRPLSNSELSGICR